MILSGPLAHTDERAAMRFERTHEQVIAETTRQLKHAIELLDAIVQGDCIRFALEPCELQGAVIENADMEVIKIVHGLLLVLRAHGERGCRPSMHRAQSGQG